MQKPNCSSSLECLRRGSSPFSVSVSHEKYSINRDPLRDPSAKVCCFLSLELGLQLLQKSWPYLPPQESWEDRDCFILFFLPRVLLVGKKPETKTVIICLGRKHHTGQRDHLLFDLRRKGQFSPVGERAHCWLLPESPQAQISNSGEAQPIHCGFCLAISIAHTTPSLWARHDTAILRKFSLL